MRLRKKPWIETAMEEVKDKYVLMHNLEDYSGFAFTGAFQLYQAV